ncbi:MAG: response regulator [bacterium]|nr:response regulator [bacterium]
MNVQKNQAVQDNDNIPLILLVDDVPQNIQILHEILSSENYSFAIAASGKETFALLEKKLPDLILLDVMLDDTDGFEICKKMKKNPKTAEVPVIFLTARVRVEDKVRGFKLGAVDYITKPFEEAEVVARVRTHVHLKQSSDMIKNYTRKLEESYSKLEASQEEKLHLEKQNALMSIAVTTTHELNQPLTVMQGYLELLRDTLNKDGMSGNQEKYLERIQQSFLKMQKILERFRRSPAGDL